MAFPPPSEANGGGDLRLLYGNVTALLAEPEYVIKNISGLALPIGYQVRKRVEPVALLFAPSLIRSGGANANADFGIRIYEEYLTTGGTWSNSKPKRPAILGALCTFPVVFPVKTDWLYIEFFSYATPAPANTFLEFTLSPLR